jgi:hypothetical protein
MLIIRAFLVTLITIAVAMLPPPAGVFASAKSVEMSMADDADTPCCPSCNDQDHLKGSVACAIKCMRLVSAVLPTIVSLPHFADEAPPSFVDSDWREHVRSPPTHPPSV